MKSIIAFARIGAVLSAVTLLGAFVYVRAGGRIGMGGKVVSLSAAATGSNAVVMPGSKSKSLGPDVLAVLQPSAVPSADDVRVMSSSKSLKIQLFNGLALPSTLPAEQPTSSSEGVASAPFASPPHADSTVMEGSKGGKVITPQQIDFFGSILTPPSAQPPPAHVPPPAVVAAEAGPPPPPIIMHGSKAPAGLIANRDLVKTGAAAQPTSAASLPEKPTQQRPTSRQPELMSGSKSLGTRVLTDSELRELSNLLKSALQPTGALQPPLPTAAGAASSSAPHSQPVPGEFRP